MHSKNIASKIVAFSLSIVSITSIFAGDNYRVQHYGMGAGAPLSYSRNLQTSATLKKPVQLKPLSQSLIAQKSPYSPPKQSSPSPHRAKTPTVLAPLTYTSKSAGTVTSLKETDLKVQGQKISQGSITKDQPLPTQAVSLSKPIVPAYKATTSHVPPALPSYISTQLGQHTPKRESTLQIQINDQAPLHFEPSSPLSASSLPSIAPTYVMAPTLSRLEQAWNELEQPNTSIESPAPITLGDWNLENFHDWTPADRSEMPKQTKLEQTRQKLGHAHLMQNRETIQRQRQQVYTTLKEILDAPGSTFRSDIRPDIGIDTILGYLNNPKRETTDAINNALQELCRDLPEFNKSPEILDRVERFLAIISDNFGS